MGTKWCDGRVGWKGVMGGEERGVREWGGREEKRGGRDDEGRGKERSGKGE